MTSLFAASRASSVPFARIIHLFLRQDRVAKVCKGQHVAPLARPEDIARDCNMLPEDVTGTPTWNADEPFFFQAGFGRD